MKCMKPELSRLSGLLLNLLLSRHVRLTVKSCMYCNRSARLGEPVLMGCRDTEHTKHMQGPFGPFVFRDWQVRAIILRPHHGEVHVCSVPLA